MSSKSVTETVGIGEGEEVLRDFVIGIAGFGGIGLQEIVGQGRSDRVDGDSMTLAAPNCHDALLISLIESGLKMKLLD